MDTTVERIKLIDGAFDPAEAADVLLSLLNDKIKFHTVQSLNLKGKLNTDISDSDQRISQLRKSKDIVKSIVVKAHKENYEILIDSDITIKLTKRKPDQ